MSLARGSLRAQLLLVVVLTTLTALVITGAAMVFNDVKNYQRAWVDDLVTQADILGNASAPALSFHDPKVAGENLALLKLRPMITAAAIYTPSGAIFASYPASQSPASYALPALPEADGYQIVGDELVVFKRIVDKQEILGTVYLRARYELVDRIKSYLTILLAAMVVSLVVATLLSFWLHSKIIRPIVEVGALARTVVQSRDYTLRATKTADNELGDLVDGFNGMLSEISRRKIILETSHESLEREIKERRGAEQALRLSEQRNSTLIAASTAVVWTADHLGHFIDAQPQWTAYTGQNRDEYCESGWRAAVHADDRGALELAWARSISEPVPFALELRLMSTQSGSYRYVGLRAVALAQDDGSVREWIGTITDIDDQRCAEKELQSLNAGLEQRVNERTAALEAANKEMESFSYSISHDLRAPVRAIAGFSRMLWEDNAPMLDDEGKRKLGIVQSEANRMGVLIDDLLAFSRLSRQSVAPINLQMGTMARAMFERIQAQTADHSATLHIQPLPDVVADRALIDQVWANLVSNAIKYSSKREQPVVEIGAISDDKEHTYFVRDNGAGFDPRHKAKLFGVFQRLHDQSEFSGTGVGLALVQRIVNRHSGRVWADGKPNEGATFYFTLPRTA
jgi:PAS domain S-box-containing protein